MNKRKVQSEKRKVKAKSLKFLVLSFSFSLFVFSFTLISFAQVNSLLIDDFEGAISSGPDGTVDYGSGNGSSVEVTASTGIKHSGKQSIKVTFDAVPDGYMWVARGFDLDASNAGWQVKPADIRWNDYNATSFYMYGLDSKTKVAFDIKDNGDEIWRFITEDNFKGWKQIVCPFKGFVARDDWQPDAADKNAELDFPLQSFQFEPRPEAQGVFYFDQVELIKE